MKKWIVLFFGIVLQLILGGIYAWSAFIPSLISEYQLSKGQCGFIFGLTIAVFSLAMIFAGRLMQKFGPRMIAIIGAILFGTGYLISSYSGGSYNALLFGFGLVTGVGIGFGYVVPLSTGMKWFPDNRGLVTGVAVGGFGGGAIALSSLTKYLMHTHNYKILEVFKFTGITFGTIAVLSAFFMSEPENGEEKEDSEKEVRISIKDKIFKFDFLLIFMGMFAGTFAGLMVIGNLGPMMTTHGLSDFYVILSISLFSIGNIIGRIGWGQIHDRLGSRNTVIFSLVFFLVGMIALHGFDIKMLPLIATPFVGAGFGGCFVVYASTIVEKYGVELFPRLYPFVFLAYGLAALTGPSLGGWLADRSGNFNVGVYSSIGVILFAIVVMIIFLDKRTNISKS